MSRNQKESRFTKENIGAALFGMSILAWGIAMNFTANRPASQLGIGDTADINNVPWVMCHSFDYASQAFTQAYGYDTSGIFANSAFMQNLASYNQTRLQGACQILHQLCTPKNLTELLHFIAEDAIINTTNFARYVGNCGSTPWPVLLIAVGCFVLMLATCHVFRPRDFASSITEQSTPLLQNTIFAKESDNSRVIQIEAVPDAVSSAT